MSKKSVYQREVKGGLLFGPDRFLFSAGSKRNGSIFHQNRGNFVL